MPVGLTIQLSAPVQEAVRAQGAVEGRTAEEVLAEIIETTFAPLERIPRAPQMAREVAAYEAQHGELIERYLGEVVAMQAEVVFDHDADEDAPFKRLDESHLDEVVLVRLVEETLPGPLCLAFFRWMPAARRG